MGKELIMGKLSDGRSAAGLSGLAGRASMLALSGALVWGLAACAASGGSGETSDADTEEKTETSAESPKAAVTPEFEVATTVTVAADQETTSLFNALDEGLCSWSQGGTDASTVEGDDYAFTPVVYVRDGAYVAEKSLAADQVSVEDGKLTSTGITIEKEAINGVVVKDSTLELENVRIEVNAADADGSTTCDFSGLGAALAAYGSSDVTVRDSILATEGVANLAVFSDDGAKVLLDGVTLSSKGGTLYEDYVNSPAQPLMVAPPWILGIMGTSRGSNEMGTNSTMSVIDSAASASNWAVLSTDAGSNMYLNVVNSTMDLTGSDQPFQEGDVFNVENPYTARSGYGTYAIGDAVETFLGTQMNVGTYATIFTGGSAYYGNLEAGKSYELAAADGSTHTTYVAEEDVPTVIESDTFGFMAHKSSNTCEIDGATVHSAYTGFLIKSGCNIDVTVSGGANVKADNGILVQAMDNDDSTTSYDNATSAFGTTHEEYAGFPTEAVSSDAAGSDEQTAEAGEDQGNGAPSGEQGGPGGEPPSGEAPDGAPGGSGDPGGEGGPGGARASGGTNQSSYTIEDTALEGSIYNGIGWKANDLSDGNVSAMTLDVKLAGTATLRGAIASTSCIHVSYDGQQYLKENGITAFDDASEAAKFAETYQLTSFTKAEYFDIGQVANLVSANGLNDINVSLSGSAVWTVSDTSLIASLKIADDAQVVVESGVTLTVGETAYGEGTYTAADFA